MTAVRWSAEAIEDLSSLHAFIAQQDALAAERVTTHILAQIRIVLAENPRIGRPGRVPGTREFVVPKTPFIVPYAVHGDQVIILRVYDSARAWPEAC